MTTYQIYCTPGDLVACWAQEWNCTPELIEEVFEIPADGSIRVRDREDNETTYQRILAGIKTLEALGYKKAAYCADCGHRIMTMELEARK